MSVISGRRACGREGAQPGGRWRAGVACHGGGVGWREPTPPPANLVRSWRAVPIGHHMLPRGLRRRCLCPVSVCCAHHCQTGGGGYGGPGVSRPASGVIRVSRCNDRAVPRGHSGARHRCCRVELRRLAPPDSPSSRRGDPGCCVGGRSASSDGRHSCHVPEQTFAVLCGFLLRCRAAWGGAE
jgi:hypothetical protein